MSTFWSLWCVDVLIIHGQEEYCGGFAFYCKVFGNKIFKCGHRAVFSAAGGFAVSVSPGLEEHKQVVMLVLYSICTCTVRIDPRAGRPAGRRAQHHFVPAHGVQALHRPCHSDLAVKQPESPTADDTKGMFLSIGRPK